MKIGKVLNSPRYYANRALKLLMRRVSAILGDSTFFLQGQMDINPKSLWYSPSFVERSGGYRPKGDLSPRAVCRLDPWDTTRRDMLVLLLRTIVEKDIPGDLAEVGVYKGDTARLIHHYVPERDLFLFDTFEGFTDRGLENERFATGHRISGTRFADTSIERARRTVAPLNERVHFVAGYFPDSILAGFESRTFAFVHLDADLYEPILEGLRFFYPRMAHQGLIVVHDYNAWPGARSAVDDFMADKPELVIPMPDKSGSALIVRTKTESL